MYLYLPWPVRRVCQAGFNLDCTYMFQLIIVILIFTTMMSTMYQVTIAILIMTMMWIAISTSTTGMGELCWNWNGSTLFSADLERKIAKELSENLERSILKRKSSLRRIQFATFSNIFHPEIKPWKMIKPGHQGIRANRLSQLREVCTLRFSSIELEFVTQKHPTNLNRRILVTLRESFHHTTSHSLLSC